MDFCAFHDIIKNHAINPEKEGISMKYLFRGGTVVSGRGTRRADVLVEDEKILRVARTIADLSGKRLLDEDSLLEALQYRAQEKVDLTF